MTIPARLAAACEGREDLSKWLDRLPGVLFDLQERWSLTIGNPFDANEGSASWVAPVTLSTGMSAVLKVGLPHMEAEDEPLGLRFWDGDPTVQLLNSDDHLGAMLLERCEPGTPLRELPEADQDVVIARLLRRLWRKPSAPYSFRPLSAMTTAWRKEALTERAHWPDPDLISEGLALFENLSKPSAADMLLATDLHAGNVLRAQREPWLVIDPKPFVGDPTYDATQHLLNCCGRLLADPDKTIGGFAALLGLDHERLRLWTFARAAVDAGCDWHDTQWPQLVRLLRT